MLSQSLGREISVGRIIHGDLRSCARHGAAIFQEQADGEVATLLKPMIETIDRFGLKARFLRKHKTEVDQFFKRLSLREYRSATALKCKQRLEKNRDTLLTFLDHDDVPWNNNNAEHAVKAFALLRRDFDGLSTEKGIKEYLILLNVCQTCKYMGVDFWISSVRARRTFTPSRKAGAGAESCRFTASRQKVSAERHRARVSLFESSARLHREQRQTWQVTVLRLVRRG